MSVRGEVRPGGKLESVGQVGSQCNAHHHAESLVCSLAVLADCAHVVKRFFLQR